MDTEFIPSLARPSSAALPKGPSTKAGDSALLSVVVPVYNEEESLPPLWASISKALGEGRPWELILVDDGSRDGSAELIVDLAQQEERVGAICFAENAGQTAAIWAGIQAARGSLIATLDADLQNDPRDLLRLIEALGDHDAVVGYRTKRQDNFVRRASSKFANEVRNRLTGDSIRDTGCSLKLFRADAIRTVPLFEGMHRFLPTLLRWYGFDVIELGVGHHPRRWGRSKYGLRNRAWQTCKDLMAVRWMRSRLIRPNVTVRATSRPLTQAKVRSASRIPS